MYIENGAQIILEIVGVNDATKHVWWSLLEWMCAYQIYGRISVSSLDDKHVAKRFELLPVATTSRMDCETFRRLQ